MTRTLAIFKKELWGYINSPIAYIFVIVFLLMTTSFYFLYAFLDAYASVSSLLNLFPRWFVLLVPALSMRLWAEERKLGTEELLLTLPVRSYHLVLGKFLAGVALIALALAGTLTVPITIGMLGNLDVGPVVLGYLGALLMGASYLALGQFLSSLTTNQVLAFILALVGCSILGLLWLISPLVPELLQRWIESISAANHFYSIAMGQIDSRDLIYFASLIVFFLYANIAALEVRKW